MRSTVILLLFVCAGLFQARAEVYPRENARINHNCVFLEEEPVAGAVRYELLYRCLGARTSPSNQPNTVLSKPYPVFFIDSLQWASRYFWKINAYDAQGQLLGERAEHTFQVCEIRAALPNIQNIRLNILTHKEQACAGGLLAIDYTRAIYDRQGNPLWVLPDIPGLVDRETQVRDLKRFSDQSIGFLTPAAAVEVNLDAQVLWKTPSPCLFGKDTLVFHHEFRKTSRGTYMVLASRKVKRALPASLQGSAVLAADNNVVVEKGKAYKWTPTSLVLEFDKQGKIIWYWDADTYLTNEDLAYKKNPNGSPVFLSHANAFSENEQATHIYVSFRDLSRIVKVNKASKKVEYSFGEKFPSGEARNANHLFRRQHDATITKRNTLLIFNNNEAPGHPDRLPNTGIVEFDDKNSGNDDVLVWRYDLDTTAANWSSGGGNVTELPNGNLLLCTGVVNRILEVNRQGELVWEARIMGKNRGEQDWKPFPQYRCSWLAQLNYSYFFAVPQVITKGSASEITAQLGNLGRNDENYLVEWIGDNKVLQKEHIDKLSGGQTKGIKLQVTEVPRGTLLLRVTAQSNGQVKVYTVRS